jgi:glycosyltransferase involved in cell wall biosynthesis
VIDNIEFGGGERVFAQIINRLPRDRYKVIVACLPGGIFEEQIKEYGARLEPLDLRKRFNPKIVLRLAGLMKREKIDIVHSQGGRADFFARITAKLMKVPVMVSTIAMPIEGYDVNRIKKSIYIFLDRFSERFVDRFMVVSESLRKTLIERHRVHPEKVTTIYNGIEVDEYSIDGKGVGNQASEHKKEFGLENDVPIIGAIGRLVWQKGLEYLLEAIPEIIKKFPRIKFLIVGEGSLRESLEMKSERLKIKENIIFTGFRKDIKTILASIDILAMPSLQEGLPMILLEAMAMAKPIVATHIDGISELLDNGRTGALAPARDSRALAAAIIDLLSHGDKASQMGLAARKAVEEKFSVETMVEKVANVYQGLLQHSPSADSFQHAATED